MTRVRKSPNMMSTTGRRPVMAAPSAMPVKPASEIGVSMTRSGPNSWTSPLSTLKGVPASATSSPRMITAGSRRISSARASRTAWAMVSCRSRTSARVDMHRHLFGARIGCRQREGDPLCDLGAQLFLHPLQLIGPDAAFLEPGGQDLDRITLPGPALLLLTGAVVAAIHVADVVPAEAVGVAVKEARPLAAASARHRLLGGFEDRADVLAVDLLEGDREGFGPRPHGTGGRLRGRRVLAVEVVLADVEHRQLPERGHVQALVEQALPQRALAEEAGGDLVAAAPARGERGPGGDPRRAGHDGVGAQVPLRLVGDVHGAALAAAVAGLLAQQLREHQVGPGSLGQAVPMAPVGARDVVVVPQRQADADRHRLLADVEVGQPRHPGRRIELVDLLLEEPDPQHLPVGAQPAIELFHRAGPTQTVCWFMNSRMPASESSRPWPERLMPPKGSLGSDATSPLTKTIPASISPASRRPRSTSRVQTEAPRP